MMTDDNDPALQTLFSIAKQELADSTFSDEVMSRIDTLRRRAAIGWSGFGLALLLCAGLVAVPLQDAVPLLTRALPTGLIESGRSEIAQVFAPVNSLGGIIVLSILGLRLVYKKLFG